MRHVGSFLVYTTIDLDFLLFYDVADRMFTTNAYEVSRGEDSSLPFGEHFRQYLYSPLFLVLMHPLTYLSPEGAFLIWRILTSVCLIRSFILALKFCHVPMLGGIPYLLLILVTLLLQRPISESLTGVTTFFLWIAMESYALIITKRYWRAGALLALGINIKLILLPVLVYWVWRGYWRVLWIVLLFSPLYLVLPALVFGWDTNLALLSNWYFVLATQDHVLLEGSYVNRVLAHLVYLTPLSAMPQFFTYALICLLILYTLYLLGRITPFSQATRPASLAEFSYILLIIPFIYPRQYTYSLVLAMPCLIWITTSLIQTRSPFVVGLAGCSWLLLLPFGIPFSLFFGYSWQFTYPISANWINLLYSVGLLSFIPLLTYLNKKRHIDWRSESGGQLT